MRQNLNNLMIAGALALATAAGAAAYDERAISQSTQAYLVTGAAGTKVAFRATGAPTDLVVIRLPDGSVFAAATLEQLKKGITGGEHKIPEDPRPLDPSSPIQQKAMTSTSTGETPTCERCEAIRREREALRSASWQDGKETEPSLGEGEVLEDGMTAVSSGKTPDPTEIELDDAVLSKEDDAAPKSLLEEPKSMEAWFTFASIPSAFHGGWVSIYRGSELLDRDMFLLY